MYRRGNHFNLELLWKSLVFQHCLRHLRHSPILPSTTPFRDDVPVLAKSLFIPCRVAKSELSALVGFDNLDKVPKLLLHSGQPRLQVWKRFTLQVKEEHPSQPTKVIHNE
eukprot:c32089_g1_i1 orf=294-623(+)